MKDSPASCLASEDVRRRAIWLLGTFWAEFCRAWRAERVRKAPAQLAPLLASAGLGGDRKE